MTFRKVFDGDGEGEVYVGDKTCDACLRDPDIRKFLDDRESLRAQLAAVTAQRDRYRNALSRIETLNDEGPYQAILAPEIASAALKEKTE